MLSTWYDTRNVRIDLFFVKSAGVYLVAQTLFTGVFRVTNGYVFDLIKKHFQVSLMMSRVTIDEATTRVIYQAIERIVTI